LSTILRGVIRHSHLKSLTLIFGGQITFILASDTYLRRTLSRGAATGPILRISAAWIPILVLIVLILTVIPNVITIVITGGSAMVELKIRKFGNSLGVVLPKEVIDRLQTSNGERLFLIESGDGDYRLTPYDPAFEKKMAKAEEIMGRYRNTLHALAK
jgi:putative addiction module antidote